jgi:hypothetical protein
MRPPKLLTSQKAIGFRRALPEEVEPLLEFAARTYYETFAPLNTPRNMQAYMTTAFDPTQFKKEFDDPQATFLLAEIDSRLAGYAKLPKRLQNNLSGRVGEERTGEGFLPQMAI